MEKESMSSSSPLVFDLTRICSGITIAVAAVIAGITAKNAPVENNDQADLLALTALLSLGALLILAGGIKKAQQSHVEPPQGKKLAQFLRNR